MVFVHAKIGELKVKDLSQKLQGISGFIFHLQLCEGQQLKHQILLKSNTEWVSLSPVGLWELVRASSGDNLSAVCSQGAGSSGGSRRCSHPILAKISSKPARLVSKGVWVRRDSSWCKPSTHGAHWFWSPPLRYIPGPVHQKLPSPGARRAHAGEGRHPSRQDHHQRR